VSHRDAEARREYARNYYLAHKEDLDARSMQRYFADPAAANSRRRA